MVEDLVVGFGPDLGASDPVNMFEPEALSARALHIEAGASRYHGWPSASPCSCFPKWVSCALSLDRGKCMNHVQGSLWPNI